MFKKIIILSFISFAACAPRIERPARAEYHAVCAERRRELSERVEFFVNLAGWRPQGGVSVVALENGYIQYCQALLKED